MFLGFSIFSRKNIFLVQKSFSDSSDGQTSRYFVLTAGYVRKIILTISGVKLYLIEFDPSLWGFTSVRKSPETPMSRKKFLKRSFKNRLNKNIVEKVLRKNQFRGRIFGGLLLEEFFRENVNKKPVTLKVEVSGLSCVRLVPKSQ